MRAERAPYDVARSFPWIVQFTKTVVAPLLAVAAFLGLWEIAVTVFELPLYLLPKPSDFLPRFFSDFGLLWHHAIATATVILGGFALGAAIAVPLALLIVTNPAMERGLYPVIVFFNIIPKTITAPLFVVWLGVGPAPRILLTMLMSFFAILVDSMSGFRSVDPRLFYISRSMGATQWQTFWRIRIPAAMPYIYSGMKIGLVDCVTAAIIAEFIGSSEGLGYLILIASGYMDLPLMFCAILATALLGFGLSMALAFSERLFMPWLKCRNGD